MSFKPPGYVTDSVLQWQSYSAAPWPANGVWQARSFQAALTTPTHGFKANNVTAGTATVNYKGFRQVDNGGRIVVFEFWLWGAAQWIGASIYTVSALLPVGCRPSSTQSRQWSFRDNTTPTNGNRNAWVDFYSTGQVSWRGISATTGANWAGGQTVDFPVP